MLENSCKLNNLKLSAIWVKYFHSEFYEIFFQCRVKNWSTPFYSYLCPFFLMHFALSLVLTSSFTHPSLISNRHTHTRTHAHLRTHMAQTIDFQQKRVQTINSFELDVPLLGCDIRCWGQNQNLLLLNLYCFLIV